ncbi:MAG TPA: radical SAM/SPASM domain-containing protein [Bacteroidales bacterium]|nr:radical SAM/SPASM domain-containing protein [Bacteroidales bacterium]
MVYSKHNIFSKITDSENFYIVNLLSGNADILNPEEAALLRDFKNGKEIPAEFANNLAQNGYLVDLAAEEKLYKSKYFDFIDTRDEDEIQLFFVPNYSCNFACTYCFQDEYTPVHSDLTAEIIDAFFNYISTEFAGRKKYITVFGGEPLLPSAKQKELISYFLSQANRLQLDVCFVTNGYSLESYVEILSSARIREIQITLDGVGKVHDERRFLKGGGATFDKIVRGIDACLQNNLPVNLRMVVDKENIGGLPETAQFAIDKGWTNNPLFKTQLGRNYELHHCQATSEKLFTRVSLYENLYKLVKQHPYIVEFYKPAYSVAKFLAETGGLPGPLFDACPACKTEWAFDYTGQIYSCTATVGKADESLGTFYPSISRKTELINEWENRDVLSISDCKTCNLQLACGGGCGSVAKNRTGSICSTDCRPITELLELGFSAYLE